MKQTAVEWLVENLHLHNDVYFVTKNKRDIIKQAKEMYEDEMKKFGIKCQMAMYSSDHVWSVEDVWDKEFKKQQDETK